MQITCTDLLEMSHRLGKTFTGVITRKSLISLYKIIKVANILTLRLWLKLKYYFHGQH